MNVRLPPAELTELDEWMAAQTPPVASRPAAIRKLIALALKR